jgi:hypothetical protein
MDKAAIICQVHRGAQAPEADMRPTRGVPRLITSLVAPDNSTGRRADAYCQSGNSN